MCAKYQLNSREGGCHALVRIGERVGFDDTWQRAQKFFHALYSQRFGFYWWPNPHRSDLGREARVLAFLLAADIAEDEYRPLRESRKKRPKRGSAPPRGRKQVKKR